MTTGYTEILTRRDDVTFREFALRCARAFGACIMMRDTDIDVPPPKKFTPDSYFEKRITEAKERLRIVTAMTDEEARDESRRRHTESDREHREYEARHEKETGAFVGMLAKVKAWTPPTRGHEGLQRFMVQQLETSITKFYDMRTTVLDGAAWLKNERETAARDLARAEERWAEELARVDERNAWISALYASLESDQ